MGHEHIAWEYQTTYFPLDYEKPSKGLLSFLTGSPSLPMHPRAAEFVRSDEYQSHLKSMGDAGYDLVSVQDVPRAVLSSAGKQDAPIQYTVTAGFFFFWKRPRKPTVNLTGAQL